MSRAAARGVPALLAVLVLVLGAGAAPSRAGAPPAIGAPQAILLEPTTGTVLFARQPDAPRPVASTTKLMTALLVLERVSLSDVFTAGSYQGLAAESRLGLRDGERIEVRDLLRALLLASANDAAQTLARGTAGSVEGFVAMMNRRAAQLGLRHTHYSNPIGLDDRANYSTAFDLVKLASRLRSIPFFRATVARAQARLDTGIRPRTVDNRNDLVDRVPFVDGVKTGHTVGAGYVLVGSASRRGVTVLSAVLGDPSEAARDADTVALLQYGLDQLRSVRVLRVGRVVATRAVRHRDGRSVGLVATRPVTRVLRRGQRATVSIRAPQVLEGPLPAGARAGSAVVAVGRRVVARVPVVTASAVPGPGLAERVVGALLEPATLALVALAALAGALVASGRRRRARGEANKAGTA